MGGWLLAILSGLVLASGLFTFSMAWQGGQKRTRRRLCQAFLLCAISILGLSLLEGGSLPVPRAVVLACPPDASDSDLSYFLTYFRRWDRVRFARLANSNGVVVARLGPWSFAGQLNRGNAGEYQRGVGTNWMEQLTSLLRRGADMKWLGLESCFKRTSVIVYAGRDFWSQFDSGNLDGTNMARALPAGHQVFVFVPPGANASGTLRLRQQPEIIPSGKAIDLNGCKIHVELLDCNLRARDATYKFRLRINPGDPNRQFPDFEENIADQDPNAPLLRTFDLSNLWTNGPTLNPMLYLMDADLTVPDTIHSGVDHVFHTRAYLRVENQNILFLEPIGAGNTFSQFSWLRMGVTNDSGSRNLTRNFVRNRLYVSPDWTDLQESQIVDYQGGASTNSNDPNHARELSLSNLTAQIHASQMVVVSEPTVENLRTLELAGITNEFQRGLSLLVIAPPAADFTNPGLPAWLPAVSIPAALNSSNAHHIWSDRRIYLLPDLSRFANFGLQGRDGMRLQLDFLNQFIREIGGSTNLLTRETQVGRQALLRDSFPGGVLFDRTTPNPWFLMGPVGLDIHLDNELMRNQYETGVGIKSDALAFHLPTRLRTLLGPNLDYPARNRFVYLDPISFYDGAVVILMGADLPQAKDAVTESIQPGAGGLTLEKLARAGVKIIPVLYKADTDISETAERLLKTAQADGGESLSHRIDAARAAVGASSRGIQQTFWIGDGADQRPEAVAREVANVIRGEDHGMLSRSNANGMVLPAGRVVDMRGEINSHTVPWLRTRLRTRANAGVVEHMVIREARSMASSVGVVAANREVPVVVSSFYRGGRVIVSAYSPWSAEMWSPSVGKARQLGTDALPQPPLASQSYGVQRLLDPWNLGALVVPLSPDRLQLDSITVLEDGATLRLDCWLDSASGNRPSPRFLDGARHPIPGNWPFWIPEAPSERISYEFFSTNRILGAAQSLSLSGKSDDPGLPIFLDLNAWSSAGRNQKEALAFLAQLHGGGILGDEELKAGAFSALQPLGMIARWLLVIISLALFSPLVRPWTAWKILRESAQGSDDRSRAPRFDVEGVLNEFGANPGRPHAGRAAGLPVGERLYETGDSLSRAKPASLLALTPLGASLGLPRRLPAVRLRQKPNAMAAALCVDFSAGFLLERYTVSKPKKALLIAVLRLLAGAVWRTGGAVSLVPVQKPGATVYFGTAEGSFEDFERFVDDNSNDFQKPIVPPSPAIPWEAVTSGSLCFLVTNGLAWDRQLLLAAIQHASQNINELRIVKLFGRGDEGFTGVCDSSLSGVLLDRTEWLPSDVAIASRTLASAFEQVVRESGCPFAAIDGEMDAPRIFEQFFTTGILS